ncbi:anemia group M [Octopus vulgaris]|uniref:Anemia group M n=1 Tax=Octopus vulgaris TaxID=6645 RepID=A0AA36FKF0_OCTVU|nr:anemia group M [Octopus vulgaris]
MPTYKFTARKKKPNTVKTKGGDGSVQPTLFQTWGAKSTVSTSNFSNGVSTVDDITIVSDDEDDILVQALESSQGRTTSPPGNTTHSAGGAPDSGGEIDLESIPDLPGFNKFAGCVWIYPTNYPVRQYQFDIAKEALFTNTLVVLPTGLGKTFIAAVVMFNFYRWYSSAKVVFMAPTKPLVAQQIEACYNIMGIPQDDMSEMTGKMLPALRKRMWKEKRVIFLTPQVLVNDLTRGTCDPESIKCVVVDEAHKSLGNHAYCQVMRELVKKTRDFRVLALSATPGNNLKMVQEVLTNLLISHVAIRMEESPDVKIYSNERKVEKIVVPLGSEIDAIDKKYVEVLESVMHRLMCRKLLYRVTAQTVSKFTVLKARDAFRQKPPQNLSPSMMGSIEGDFGLLISLCHGHELLQLHGLRSFYQYIANMMDTGSGRSRQELFKNPAFVEIYEQLQKEYGGQNISFTQMSTQQKAVPYVLGHPKLEKLLEIVVSHFKNFQKENDNLETRVMIFSQYRNSVTDIADMLKRERPLIKAMSFIGQSVGKNTKGFTQKEQIKVMKEFREGGYNTLIATCIGEEGLDIGDVDLIICFDTCKSPVRFVQRMGRTGRKRDGKIIMLITKGKEEQMYNQARYQWNSLNKSLSNKRGQLVFYNHQPIIFPEGLVPRCHKTNIVVKESFQSIHGPKEKKLKKSSLKKQKTTRSKKGNQDISLFTSPVVPMVDTYLQPTTSAASRVQLVNEPGRDRMYSLLSSSSDDNDDGNCELPDLNVTNFKSKEKLCGKKTSKTSGKDSKTAEKTKKKSKKVVGKSKNQIEKISTESKEKKKKNKNKKKKESFSGDEILNDEAAVSSSPRFGISSLLNKHNPEYCSESVSDVLLSKEANSEISKEALGNTNHSLPDMLLSPIISSNVQGSLLQTSKAEKSLHGSMVPAAPVFEAIPKLIDDFRNVLSSQSPDLDLGHLTKKWDNEFEGLKSLRASDTAAETPLKGPLAISKNVSRKRKLEGDDDADEDVMTESERIENISVFAPNISEEMAEKTVKSDKLKISEENTSKSTAKCHLSTLSFCDKDFFSDSSLFLDDDFDDFDGVVKLLSPQLTNATNTKIRTSNSRNASRLSNSSNRTNRADTSGPSNVISKISPSNTTASSNRSSTTSPVDTNNTGITTGTTRPVDTSITNSPSNTNSTSYTTISANTNITTRPNDKNSTSITTISTNTSITTVPSNTNITTRPSDKNSTSITTVSANINNTSVKPNWVFRHQEPINKQANADNKVPANEKKLNPDPSLSVSKLPTSKSSLELCEDNGGELVDDGIYFDLSADMFSDFDDDLSKGKNDSNNSNKPRTSRSFLNDDRNQCIREAPFSGKETGPSKRVSGDGGINSTLGCKLSSLINSNMTIKDSSISNKIPEDSLNFDLEFDSEDDNLFKSTDNTGQQSDLVLEDNDVPEFSLEFDFDDGSPLTVNESCSPQGNQSETVFGINMNTANNSRSQSEERSQSRSGSKTIPFLNYSINSSQMVETMVNEGKEGKNSGHLKLPSLTVAESPFQCASSRSSMSYGSNGNVTPQLCGKVTPGLYGKVTPGPSGKVTPKPLQQLNSYSNSLHGSVKSCPTTNTTTTTTTTTTANNDDDVVHDDNDMIVLDDDDDDDEVIIKPKRKAVIFSPSSDGSTPRSEVKGRRGTNPSATGLLSSDLDSPVTINRVENKKRFTGKKRRVIEDESNESDFENGKVSFDFEARLSKPGLNSKRSTPKPVVVSQSKRRKIQRKNVNGGRQFLDEEAVVSGSDSESSNDDEIANELDNYEGSFIDDNYTLGRSQVDMRTVYLKSVKSPLPKPNAYKLQYRYHATDVFSQESEPDADCYEDDSFLDDSSEISTYNDTAATENATQEIVSMAKMAKSKAKDSNKKRIIRSHLQSTSEEEEEEGNRFALSLDLQEKGPKATNATLKPLTSNSSTFQNREPAIEKLVLFADSRQISGAQEILSNLRSKFNMDVVVTKLSGSDFLVSLRTGVERIYMSEFSNFSNKRKITESLQHLIDLHDRPCLIVEKNPVKKGLACTKTPFYQTKYLEKLLSRISLSPIKLLFSDSKDETCSLLAKLCSQEEKRGFAIACPTLTLTEEQRIKFLLSLPQLNYALALNLSKNFTSLKQLLTSSAEEISQKGKTSAALANKIHDYIHCQSSKDL